MESWGEWAFSADLWCDFWLCVWGWLFCCHGLFWAYTERLRTGKGAAPGAQVAVVIPARDEAETIGRAVASLRAQRCDPPLRIIVADDESSDGTGDLARRAGADVVVRVPPRPNGWKGKLWAVSNGLREIGPEAQFVLLSDADIEHISPDLLAALLERAGPKYDLVSVMVRLRCRSVAEQFLIPAFVFFFFMLYPPLFVNLGGPAAAAGGCMLVRREMLDRIGGVDGIRDQLIDDCALARKVRSAGGKVWLGVSELETRSIRDYNTWSSVRAMISRSAFEQLRHSGLLLVVAVVGMLMVFVAPAAWALFGQGAARFCGALTWALGALMFLPSIRRHRAWWLTAPCLPLIALFYLWATVESAVNYWSGRGGLWKGRVQDAK